jgi:hypothetical protein
MGNLHAMVIYHVRQVVRGVSIRLNENRIVVYTVDKIQLFVAGLVLAGFTIDQIIEHRVTLHLQSDDMCLSIGRSIF